MAARKNDVVVKDGAVYILRAGTSIFVKMADLCAMTGKSNQWLGQLVSQGTLSRRSTPHGAMFDAMSTLRAYFDMLEARAAKSAKTEDEIRLEASLKAADKTLKVAKATIAQLEARELRNKMHRAEDVKAMTEDLLHTIKDELLALPGRLSADAANAKTAAEAAETIRKEVYRTMEEISRYRFDSGKYEERVREGLIES